MIWTNWCASNNNPLAWSRQLLTPYLRSIHTMRTSIPCADTTACVRQVLYGDLSDIPLEQLSAIAQEVYLPLLSNPRNQDGWPEVVTKEVLENLHKFIANVYVTIGQTKGKTLLPLPPAEGSEAGDKAMRDKDRIHVLESAVVTWTRQIKNVLKIEPDEARI